MNSLRGGGLLESVGEGGGVMRLVSEIGEAKSDSITWEQSIATASTAKQECQYTYPSLAR